MPDSGALMSGIDEVSESTITVASECYCSLDNVRAVLAQLPVFNGHLIWETPCVPDPVKMVSKADAVLIVSDKASLPMAIERSENYMQAGQAPILIYLQDDKDASTDGVPGLMLHHFDLRAGLLSLAGGLFEPVIPQGLVCIDWHDTRHIMNMGGQIIMEEATGSRPEAAVEGAVSRLKERTAGRAIYGLQASILCGQNKLTARDVHSMMSTCKKAIGETAMLIIGAPFLDLLKSNCYEVRLFAKVGPP